MRARHRGGRAVHLFSRPAAVLVSRRPVAEAAQPPKNAPLVSCASCAKFTFVTEVDSKLPMLELPDHRIEAPVRTKFSLNRFAASAVVPRSITPDHSTSNVTVAGTEGPSLRAFGRLP